jgi:hypothetical protein
VKFQVYDNTILILTIVFMSLSFVFYNFRLNRFLSKLGTKAVIKQFVRNFWVPTVLVPIFLFLLPVLMAITLFQPLVKTRYNNENPISVNFILDNSLSMSALEGETSRFVIMNDAILQICSNLNKKDTVSITYFSGMFYPLCPPTVNKLDASRLLASFNIDDVPVRGSSIIGLDSFVNILSSGNRQLNILITDGDFHTLHNEVPINGQKITALVVGASEPKLISDKGKMITTTAQTELLAKITGKEVIRFVTSKELITEIENLLKEERKVASQNTKVKWYDISWVFASLLFVFISALIVFRW